jgi:hypothetical protein
MANFDVRVVAATGVALVEWDDHATSPASPRINPLDGRPHRYWKVNVGSAIEIHCIVDGVEAPLDAALGGNTFRADMAEQPGLVLNPSSPAGQSSVINVRAFWAGHYLVNIFRTNGGSMHVHFDAE